MRKILITYATAGEGHKRAAFAVKAAFDSLNPPGCEVKIVDSLDYSNTFFKQFYPGCYLFMVTYMPTIWGLFYYFLDFKWFYPVVRVARRIVNGQNSAAFEKFLIEYNPDVIVTTHFLTCEVVGHLKRRGLLRSGLITCVTDFRMHSFWFSEETDLFCVGFSETKDDLVNKWGFPKEKISVTGIPIHSKFYESKNRYDLCDKHNLDRKLFKVLITGGGFGVGPIMGLVKTLAEMGSVGANNYSPLQVLVVCGHNKKLEEGIKKTFVGMNLKTFGFIDYVDELMSASDLGVTKAGGLICSEAIAKELPLVIISPIPGQESRNCALLLKNNAAFRINRPPQLKKIIDYVYSGETVLRDMKANVRMIKKDDAAATIVKSALTM